MFNNMNNKERLGDNLLNKIYDYEHQYDVSEDQEFYFTYNQDYGMINSNTNTDEIEILFDDEYYDSVSDTESSENESDIEFY